MNYIINILKKIIFRIKHLRNLHFSVVVHSIENLSISKGVKIDAYSVLKTTNNIKYGKINIGEKVNIRENSYIFSGNGDILIGSNTCAGNNLILLGGGHITIGKDVLISHNVVITSSSHDMKNKMVVATKSKSIFSPITIEDNVFIGANATILMGSTIKSGSIIGAGSVVTENMIIGKNEVWAGNPAKLKYTRQSIKKQIEKEIHKYLKKYPFHNLFILYKNGNIVAPEFGGTCSDRSMHFKVKLEKKFKNSNIDFKLHRAYINDKDTHTIIRININNNIYFADVGMGFPMVKLFPASMGIKFESYGIKFESTVINNSLSVYYSDNENTKKKLMHITLDMQSQKEVLDKITKRSEYLSNIPLSKDLQYLFIHDGKFYQFRQKDHL